MNPILQPLYSRRSVRRFTGAAIDDARIHDLLEAAMAAPSAAAKDPWHFIVVKQPALLDQIAAALPNGRFLPQAGLGIVVCGDITKTHAQELSFLLQDVGASIENLLLAASMLGLGACWLGVHPREDRMKLIADIFNLPANIIPVSVIAVGHPADQPAARTRYRSEAVHTEGW